MPTPMIPVYRDGALICFRPDYSVPGVREAVEAEVTAGEEWPMGGSRLLAEMSRRNRRDERREVAR